MTCIAILRKKNGKITMAGDRRASMGWSQAFDMPGPKIRKDETGILLGAAGSGNLCTVLVNIMTIPEIETKDIAVYMYHKFKDALKKALMSAGYVDEHRALKIPQEDGISAIVVVKGRPFLIDVRCPDEYSEHGNILGGIIEIEESPTPFAVGCGAQTAIPILLAEKRREGFSKQEHLKLAMELAAEISPGCSNSIDFISE